MDTNLIIPSFIAGILTFLAPCTLPLVPGYLAFISGVSLNEIRDPLQLKHARWKIFLNGVFFILGFSGVFILLGTLAGLGGLALAPYRARLAQIGGIIVIFFGLYMVGLFKLPLFKFLESEKRISVGRFLTPGHPLSSFIFGATFAFGWTPCVGPILGSILLLASASTTVGQGALLLSVFSLGLAVPFLLVAFGIGSASAHINKISKYLNVISIMGGIFLVVLGFVLLTNKLSAWIGFFYRFFDFVNYEKILNYL
ncbi:sulfite exporter TauE/SafE family protein [Candidatus Peregrinibacteria bacterium]|nr:sulfite exporter TauE/SafE family protein [Candidatus Peregrinibacteria bacterium]